MPQLPTLTDTAIRSAVHAHYELTISALDFLPIGNDLLSFVYRAEAGGGSYLLKLRAKPGFRAPSLLVPRYFYEQNIPHIVAPIPTLDRRLWIELDSYVLMLYPFLDARTAAVAGLTVEHWQALGTTLHQIHTSALPPELQAMIRHETFIPWRRELLTKLEALIADGKLNGAAQHELAQFWQDHHATIRAVIERADTLGAQLRQAPPPAVLCHADLHTWNILRDSAGQLWIVDWDEIVLAPKERDLMFVIGGIGRDLVSAPESGFCLQGYNNPAINRQALTYYRYAWAVQDMGASIEEVFFTPALDEAERAAAVRTLIAQFAPGNIVDIARADDTL